jgi:IclR family mhp operon transcriptional activator
MESTRPIRALMRGLDAMTVLNSRDGATVSEVAQEIRLPRTTVYRILETLCNAGFVFRDAVDDRYRLTVLVRGLAEGFDDEEWVAEVAKPQIEELGRDVVWPIGVATLSSGAMMFRETTDHSTPLATERYSAGVRAPLLASAAGRAYLAFCPAAQREQLLDQLARSNKDDDKPARTQRADIERMLGEAQAQGYATATRTRRLVDEVSVAVPVMLGERVLAVVSLRFTTSALPAKAGLDRFLPKLRQCAVNIGNLLSEKQAVAHAQGAPEAAV